MTLRRRIFLTVFPLAAMLVAVVAIGAVLFLRLGRNSDAILKENYDSVRAMAEMAAALARADRALEGNSRPPFDAAWAEVERQFEVEANNLTIIPEEPALAAELREALDRYRDDCNRYFAKPESLTPTGPLSGYYSLHEREGAILALIRAIRDLNEREMIASSHTARANARLYSLAFALGTLAALALAGFTIWRLQRTILGPIRTVTDAAVAIGGGDLKQQVPVVSADEVGRMAEAFNAMAGKLRIYRQTNLDHLSRARLAAQATVDTFPDPVLVLDPGGAVEFANPAAAQLFGIGSASDNTAPHWQPPEALRPALERTFREQRPILADSFDQAITFRFHGEERAYLPQYRPIAAPDGDTLGIAVVLNDITRFRLLDQFKSDWVATVSHELKTPLTSVQLALHVLLEEVVGPLTPKQTEFLLEARENADRLLRLIRQLLALAKLEDQKDALERKPANPADLLQAAANHAAGRARDKEITVAIDAPADLLHVAADEIRFGQALNNLLDNAVSYTPAGGTISLKAAAANGSITLTVADTGIGIPPADMPHVFQRFFRVAGRDGAMGTGLGLSIVKDVVEAHGGTIRCTSEVGHGTTFTISLPVVKEGP